MAAITHDGYVIGASPAAANQVSYDNTTSGLNATTTQSAIDEVDSLFSALGLSVVNGEVRQTVIKEV